MHKFIVILTLSLPLLVLTQAHAQSITIIGGSSFARDCYTARTHPRGSKVWANEIIQRAPMIQDYLETTLREWTASRVAIIEKWIAEGRIAPIEPRYLLYMIWATTQHYADFGHQISTLNGDNDLSEAQFAKAKDTVTQIILRGIGAIT